MGKRQTRDEDWAPASTRSARQRTAGSATPGPSSRKPGRTSVACAQCRQRKSECSLSGPADNPDDLPSRQLKQKVDRLEELLKSLAAPTPSSDALPSPPPTAVPSLRHSRASSAPTVLDGAPLAAAGGFFVPSSRPTDRARLQACISLTRAILSGEAVPPLSVPGSDTSYLSARLQHIEEQHTPSNPFFQHPVPSNLHALVSPDEYDHGVRAVLPTPQQAQLAISSFFALANPFLNLLHPPTFLAQCDIFWRTGNVPEPHWLATYLMACGGGLMAAPDAEMTGAYASLPTGEAKELLARTWMDAARRVLAANSFMLRPTIEGIRALHLLLQWWTSEGGRYFEQALSITSSIVSVAFDLQLNRDPDEVAPDLPPVEAELRRQLFWSTYTFEAMIRPLLGNAWQAFDMEDVSCRFPDPDPSNETGAGTDIPSPLFCAAALNFRINKLVSRVRLPSAEEVAKVLDELEALDDPQAHDVLGRAMIRWGYLRLQRFASKAGLTSDEQDRLSERYFGELLSSVDAMLQAGGGTSTIVLVKILSAAVAAAVDIAGIPFAIACTDPIAAQLADLLERFRTRAFPANLARIVSRTTAVLEHLLPSPDEAPFVPPSFYSEPASEASFASELATPSTASSAPSDFAAYPGAGYLSERPAYLPAPEPVTTSYTTPHFVPSGVTYAAEVPQDQPQQAHPAILRETRPALSLFTSMAPPLATTKALTPIAAFSAISPWVDAAITPSRYVGNPSWERFF
ncbi:hypothetical protein JCM10213v2_004051 [Rhodosporidiobolus nylandii]